MYSDACALGPSCAHGWVLKGGISLFHHGKVMEFKRFCHCVRYPNPCLITFLTRVKQTLYQSDWNPSVGNVAERTAIFISQDRFQA